MQGALEAEVVHAQAALAKHEKISDVMIGHFSATAATLGNHYRLLILAHGLKMYPENFSKLAPVVLIWQMFRLPLLSIKTQTLNVESCLSL